MKRMWTAFALAAVLTGAAACGQGGSESGGGEKAEETFRVGLVFDVGGKGDKSFNDSAFLGLQRASEDFPIQISDFEPGQDADREVGLRKLAARGYDVVVGVGFLFTDAIRSVAMDFPDVKFVLVDGRINRWYVDDGDVVSAGEAIVEIIDVDPRLLERLNAEREALARSPTPPVPRAGRGGWRSRLGLDADVHAGGHVQAGE